MTEVSKLCLRWWLFYNVFKIAHIPLNGSLLYWNIFWGNLEINIEKTKWRSLMLFFLFFCHNLLPSMERIIMSSCVWLFFFLNQTIFPSFAESTSFLYFIPFEIVTRKQFLTIHSRKLVLDQSSSKVWPCSSGFLTWPFKILSM